MSAFDVENFLNQDFTGGIDTRRVLHKPGEFTGMIGTGEKDILLRDVNTKAGARKILEVNCQTDDPAGVGEGGRGPARCRYSAWLDFTDDGQALDFGPGKNRGLGMLLFALGFQDKDGKNVKPWSFKRFAGMPVKYHVAHTVRQDNGEFQDNVDAVARP